MRFSASSKAHKKLTTAVGLTNTNAAKMSVQPPPELYKLAAFNGPYIKLAALSGAAAVILGAYGTHKMNYPDKENSIERQRVFETANKYHFIHSLALLGLPLARYKFVPATFMISGIILFCGTCYYYAFSNDKRYNKLTPVGGTCFILAWLGMCI